MFSHPAPARHAALFAASLVFVLTAAAAILAPAPAQAQDTPDFRAEFQGQFEATAQKLVALSEAGRMDEAAALLLRKSRNLTGNGDED